MSSPGFFFSERPRFVELPQARERVSTATGQRLHARLPSISECSAGKRPISCEQIKTTNDRHYCFIIGSAEALPIVRE